MGWGLVAHGGGVLSLQTLMYDKGDDEGEGLSWAKAQIVSDTNKAITIAIVGRRMVFAVEDYLNAAG